MGTTPLRRRFWVEAGLSALGLLLGILTVVVPDWIEVVTGLDPDGGSGAVEWAAVVVLLAFAAVSAIVARAEFTTARPTASD